eukprot:SAG22_NODE_291_length_12933_cov_5.599657_8_plen_186_part_00
MQMYSHSLASRAMRYDAWAIGYPTWQRYSSELQDLLGGLLEMKRAGSGRGSGGSGGGGVTAMECDGSALAEGWSLAEIRAATAHRLNVREALRNGWMAGMLGGETAATLRAQRLPQRWAQMHTGLPAADRALLESELGSAGDVANEFLNRHPGASSTFDLLLAEGGLSAAGAAELRRFMAETTGA